MSAREIKQHDERLEEILSAAQELFSEFGYDKVSVQKIIDRVGIAKGTFYHYFASKEELLNELVERFANGLIEDLMVIASDETLTAPQKLNEIMLQGTKAKLSGTYSEFIKVMTAIMMNPANTILVQKITARTQMLAIPLYSSILKQGSDEGVFDVEFFDETSEMMISISKSLQGKFQALFTIENSDDLKAEFERLMYIFETSTERLLGAEKGSLKFVSPEVCELMNQFCKSMESQKKTVSKGDI